MGKKAQLKIFRQLAAQLPPMQIGAVKKSMVKGDELIGNGVTVIKSGINGEIETSVRPGITYIQSTPVAVDVNHQRRLRSIHKALGLEGIKAYVSHVKKVQEKATETSQ